MEKNKVSYEAFIEEIQNWELTLSREQKKLRLLRGKIQSKILRNEVQIIMTEIEAEIIQYRKLKDFQKIQAIDIIQEYNGKSKKFLDLMQTIGNVAEKIDSQNGQHLERTFQLDFAQHSNEAEKSKYQNETFTYMISKQQKAGKANHGMQKSASRAHSKKSSLLKQNKTNDYRNNSKKGKNCYNSVTLGVSHYKSSQDFDAWEIKYQLSEIKSMMASIQNEIKYHGHEDIEAELGKVQHNNKKMSLELKGLKEDSQYIMSRIQKLKDQLTSEKQVQAQMIHEFEHPQRRSRKSKTKSISDSRSRDINQGQDVSEWVRIRI